jgi:hypothetical protein
MTSGSLQLQQQQQQYIDRTSDEFKIEMKQVIFLMLNIF